MRSRSSLHRKKPSDISHGGPDTARSSLAVSRSSVSLTGERTVGRLRLSKVLTVPDTTTIHEACKKMASRRLDAMLLTDSNALLCGILTDKDITVRAIAQEVNIKETTVSKIMTKNPEFVLSETLIAEALQKMVQGKFRHLPVVENKEVIGLLDIARCLYDVITRLERVAEKGKAIAAAVEGVEKSWGTDLSVSNAFIEALQSRIFRPSLSTIIPENTKVLKVSILDSVLAVAKKMLEFGEGCAVVMIEDKLRGIVTSKDILTRVVAKNLSPTKTTVEKIMTLNPEYATVDMSLVDALHILHDGKFMHLPILDKAEGDVVAVADVLVISHAAITTAENPAGGVSNEAMNMMILQSYLEDSALALSENKDDEDTIRSEEPLKNIASAAETGRTFPTPTSFSFKIEDREGRMYRFITETRSLADVITEIVRRVGSDFDPHNMPPILYEDEDRDAILLTSDSDLQAAIDHARLIGWKSLRLHLDYSKQRERVGRRTDWGSEATQHQDYYYYHHHDHYSHGDGAWAAACSAVATGAAFAAGLGLMAFLLQLRRF